MRASLVALVEDSKTTKIQVSLQPPLKYSKINKSKWNPNSKINKSTVSQLLEWLQPIYAANKKGKVRNIGKGTSEKTFGNSWKLINYLRTDNDLHDVVKISTIVERIRERSKRDANIQSDPIIANKSSRCQKRGRKNRESLNPHLSGDRHLKNHKSRKASKDNSDIASDSIQEIKSASSKRQKRSPHDQRSINPYVAGIKNEDNVPKLAMFYRHPQLTVEDQQHHHQNHQESSKSSKTRKPREESNWQKKTTARPLYKPFFKECNDSTAASEVDDLNIPPPRLKDIKRKKPYIPGIDNSEEDDLDSTTQKTVDTLRNDKQRPQNRQQKTRNKISAVVNKSTKSKPSGTILSSSIRPIAANGTYVNLRDHQEETKQKTSSGSNKKSSLPVSPGIPGYPKDIPAYNPDNIPYVEVPDYTDQREESLDEDDRRVAKERYRNGKEEGRKKGPGEESDEGELMLDRDEDVVDPDAPLVSDVIPDLGKNPERTSSSLTQNKATGKSESTREGHKDVQVGREKITLSPDTLPYSDVLLRYRNAASSKNSRNEPTEEKGEDTSGEKFGLPGLSTRQDQLEKKGIEDDSEDEYKEFGISGEEDKTVDRKEDDDKPVDFNIDDYIKPFDYDKIFKGKERQSDDESTDYSPDSTYDVGGKSSSDESLPENFSGEYTNPFENDTFLISDAENYTNEEAKDVVIVKPEEFQFGDKNFFEPISDKEREKSDRFISGSEFLSSLFSEEEPSERKEDLSEKKSVESSEEEDKEETYKPLSSSLEKKDYIPDFGDGPTSKISEPRPAVYNDFWTLEYSFPPGRINDELQEESGQGKKIGGSTA